MPRLFDLRDGEGRVALWGLAVLLLLVITAHTVLEAARDALLLTGPGPKALGIVYMIIAVCAWPAAGLAARAGVRFGPRRALGGVVASAAALPAVLFFAPTGRFSSILVYVSSGVIASVVVPQFWMLAGSTLTIAQGRRLFGLIAAAGVLGGVLGSGMAAATLLVLPVRALLLVSSFVFLAAGVVLVTLRSDERPPPPSAAPRPPVGDLPRALRDEPFLGRIALLVVLSTSTLLILDYFFKSTVARTLPSAQIGPFIARYYLALNGVSLVVQVFIGSAVVRRMGVPSALVLTPALLLVGAASALATGGALLGVLFMKGIDGSLRYSIHRITGELVYLPVAPLVRQRVKPLIDGALGRAAQTLTGAALLAAAGTWVLAPRPLAVLVTGLVVAWVVVAVTMRRPYVALLRRALSSGSIHPQEDPDPIDLESAQLLVQHLASEDPLEVVGAMNALSRRGRQGFVSALILLHGDEQVLVEALESFGASSRSDWIPLGRRLLDDRREAVRMAAARALARHDELDPDRLAKDVGWRVRGYVAVHLSLRDGAPEALRDERVASLLQEPGGDDARLGMLAAIADAAPSDRLSTLLADLARGPRVSHAWAELVARAAATQKSPGIIPQLVDLLSSREGREAVRAALVSLGDRALDAVWATLADTSRPRKLRMHLPKTLARFGTKRAADRLLESVEHEPDGFVRYKSIRALGVLVAEHRIPIDRLRVERLAVANVRLHFRLLGLRAALSSAVTAAPTGRPPPEERLLLGLLDDKQQHALERAFRLLEVAHPRQDIRRVRIACFSDDVNARGNAGELLDTLLRRRDQDSLRALFRIVADDMPVEERLRRAAPILGDRAASSRGEALAELSRDADPTVAELAKLCETPRERRAARPAVRIEVSHA